MRWMPCRLPKGQEACTPAALVSSQATAPPCSNLRGFGLSGPLTSNPPLGSLTTVEVL